MRGHDVTALTGRELEQARRELAASLALARPGAPARVPILARTSAIDTELAHRATGRAGGVQAPRRRDPGGSVTAGRGRPGIATCRGVTVPGPGPGAW